VLAVGDGAGSVSKAAEGSRIVCQSFRDFVHTEIQSSNEAVEFDEACFKRWLADFQLSIDQTAKASSSQTNDYSTTIVAAVVGATSASFLQIGDGVIVHGDLDGSDEFFHVFWPKAAEYANATYFATAPDAAKHMQTSTTTDSFNKIAILSDGLQRMALHMASESVHSPFFQAVFKVLPDTDIGFSEEAKRKLNHFLESPGVLARSDDDKSLVMATTVRSKEQ
jgi:hypothetical protein